MLKSIYLMPKTILIAVAGLLKERSAIIEMRGEEEIKIPVTTGETVPVTTGTGATPHEVEEDGAPVLFGGVMAKITT
ncbi:UNVERIFIED_CONTAM: hypothetical protein K2H54_065836 [Gekko kuhli]